MAETKNPGDKLSVSPTKTLTLKRGGGVEQGVVRQSFSHGRTKQVVVEKKPKRRLPGEGGPQVVRARKRRLRRSRPPRARRPPRLPRHRPHVRHRRPRRATPVACCCGP